MIEREDVKQDDIVENRITERRKMFDSSAGLYTATFPLIWRIGFPSLHQWLASELNDSKSILDAGTGPGYWARYIASVKERDIVVGLDFSHQYIIRAKKYLRMQNVQLIEGDINITPFKEHSYDGILCSGVLDTFPNVKPALYEFNRLLVKGGKLILILRGKGSVLSRFDEYIFRYCVGMMRVIKNRSMSSLHISDKLWNKEPLWNKLASLASETNFRPVQIRSSRVITTAILIKDGSV